MFWADLQPRARSGALGEAGLSIGKLGAARHYARFNALQLRKLDLTVSA
jgi:hypothetical protein